MAELRRRIEALGPPPAGDDQPSERIWRRFIEQFRDAMAREDPRAFLRWPTIAKAMFVSNQPYLSIELLSLRSRRDWRRRWRPALRESPVGHPVPFWALPWSSGNLIHHAYHLAQFEARTGRPAERFPAVFEFGGGYGSMCRLFHQLGFSGRYVIYDLPQFSALQAFYLGSLGLPLVDADRLAGADRGVTRVSDPAALERALRWADRSRRAVRGHLVAERDAGERAGADHAGRGGVRGRAHRVLADLRGDEQPRVLQPLGRAAPRVRVVASSHLQPARPLLSLRDTRAGDRP